MPDYVTTFEISDRKKSGARLGSELLEVVKGLIEEELRESAEEDMVGDTAYAEISARDLEVNKQGDRMSVDVRLCTQGKGVFVDIRSLLFAKAPYKMPRPPRTTGEVDGRVSVYGRERRAFV